MQEDTATQFPEARAVASHVQLFRCGHRTIIAAAAVTSAVGRSHHHSEGTIAKAPVACTFEPLHVRLYCWCSRHTQTTKLRQNGRFENFSKIVRSLFLSLCVL